MALDRHIAWWLFFCCVMVITMVAIGGVTRLTGSGLSMTNWQPISGVLPPLSYSDWTAEFESYRQSPEYRDINFGMTLDEFKGIFWLEYIHRVAGRFAGLVFLLPLLFFLYKKAIGFQLGTRLVMIFFLGGIQGIIGWFMVSSGLKDKPHVSPYWLVFHLSFALAILTIIFVQALSLLGLDKPAAEYTKRFKLLVYSLPFVVFVQIMFGGFVAGLDAGLVHNTYPDMSGEMIPGDLFFLEPWYINFFENHTTVQFVHRMMAVVLALVIVCIWGVVMKNQTLKEYRVACHLLLFGVVIQFVLGVATLLYHVPVMLASLHQLGGVFLLMISVYFFYMVANTQRPQIA